MNKKLTYTQKGEQPYKHISTFLAPEGSYYVDSVTYVFPVMYITVWEDPKGFLHTIPVWEEEINRAESEEGNMDVFIENTINEDRRLERCMTCKRFFELIEKYSSEWMPLPTTCFLVILKLPQSFWSILKTENGEILEH